MSNISLETMMADKREGFLKWYASNASTMVRESCNHLRAHVIAMTQYKFLTDVKRDVAQEI